MTLNDSTSWYAIHTKPHQEERASENLAAGGIEILAPRLATRKDNPAWKLLFPGYIFARFCVNQMLQKVQFTRGVAQVVSFGGVPAVIDDEVIACIRARTDDKGVIHSLTDLKRGDMVVIHSGPLKNFAGVFQEEIPARERIRILLTTAAFKAHVEISKYDASRMRSSGQTTTYIN